MMVIDRETFDELKQMSGGDFINELIDAFLEEAPHVISNMRTTLAARDVETFRRNAHSLKSNAQTFGVIELAAQAKKLEFMARENNLDFRDGLEVLEDAYNEIERSLRELRK